MLLSEEALKESNLLNSISTTRLVQKATSGGHLGEVDEMALVGVLSTQLVYHQFVKVFNPPRARSDERIKVVDHVKVDAQVFAEVYS